MEINLQTYLQAKTFNETDITIPIQLTISIGEEIPNSKEIFSIEDIIFIQEKIKQTLGIKNFKFTIISKDFENIMQRGISFDHQKLINTIEDTIIKQIKEGYRIKDQHLIRIRELLKDRKQPEAIEVAKELNSKDKSHFTKFEYEEGLVLIFKLLESEKDNFEKYKELLKDNPIKLKELYFDYIKYLENIRNEHLPIKLIREFEQKFPLSILTDEEQMIYHYLKGRNYYLRGEYLQAILHLSKAKAKNKNNERWLASIYNTTANIFTDNLFFEEAIELATRALNIRSGLKLPEQTDSLSLLGTIYFKWAKYDQAYDFYKKAEAFMEQKTSRIYNYLAKTASMLRNFDEADAYIKQSLQFETSKNQAKGFLHLIKAIYFYQSSNFEDLSRLYESITMDSSIYKKLDKFVIGWLNAIYAKSLFDKQDPNNALKSIYYAILSFMEDQYFFEAYYVSLIPYIYDVSLSQTDSSTIFEEDLSNISDDIENATDLQIKLQNIFGEYVRKHSDLPTDYQQDFDLQIHSKNRLLNFSLKTQNIENLSKEELSNLLSSIDLK